MSDDTRLILPNENDEEPTDEATKVLCGVAAYRNIDLRTVQCLFNTLGALPYSFNMATHMSANVANGRNVLAEVAQENNAEYLWFVDQDMMFRPEHLEALVEVLDQDEEAGLVGGFYTSRNTDLRPLVGWTNPETDLPVHPDTLIENLLKYRGQVVEADFIPTGFMLVRTAVLEDIDRPWFHIDWPYLEHENEELRTQLRSSDNVFVQKVQEAGWKTLAHMGVEVGHIGDYVFEPAHLYANLEIINQQKGIQKVKQEALKRYGANTQPYWNMIYEAEAQAGRARHYPFHEVLASGIQPGWRVADVASGPGVLAQKMSSRAKEVQCFDISDVAVRMCEDAGLPAEQIDFVKENLSPKHHKAYDCVVSTEFLEHVEDPAKVVKKMYGLLKPGGLLMVTVPDDRLPPEEEPEHVDTFTQAKLGNLLSAFEDVNVAEYQGYLIGMGLRPGGSPDN